MHIELDVSEEAALARLSGNLSLPELYNISGRLSRSLDEVVDSFRPALSNADSVTFPKTGQVLILTLKNRKSILLLKRQTGN